MPAGPGLDPTVVQLLDDMYAAYDSDPRTGGPDGYDAFVDAVTGVLGVDLGGARRADPQHAVEVIYATMGAGERYYALRDRADEFPDLWVSIDAVQSTDRGEPMYRWMAGRYVVPDVTRSADGMLTLPMGHPLVARYRRIQSHRDGGIMPL